MDMQPTTDSASARPNFMGVIVLTIGFPLLVAVGFVTVASIELHWSNTSILCVSVALATTIAALGVPLASLLKEMEQPMSARRSYYLTILTLMMVGAVAIFTAVASHALGWSGTSTFVVLGGFVAIVAFLGSPLILLTSEMRGEPQDEHDIR
jgi:hypothetical protein